MGSSPIVIIGCGYTGRRVAVLLLREGRRVVVTTRDPASLADLSDRGAKVHHFDVAAPVAPLKEIIPDGAVVLHSVPTSVGELGPGPSRVVHISTTGVYGKQTEVDEHTPPAPATERQKRRRALEEEIEAGPWPSLILRPAAIYGPGRGLHVMMREGRYRLAGDGENFVSRIHVQDLARIAAAALDSTLTGAYPVADDEPARAREVAGFVAGYLSLPRPASADPSELPETMRSTRRVDGFAIREKLKISLLYPSYREGIPASLK
jgi:nucleoside-diphosphate-sugar epimerase